MARAYGDGLDVLGPQAAGVELRSDDGYVRHHAPFASAIM
jgi:hypothetical protein